MGHTKGPWEVKSASYKNGQTGREGTYYCIAANGITLPMDSSASPDAKDNAHLLAAAPDLLAALCQLVDEYIEDVMDGQDSGHCGCDGDDAKCGLCVARASIARARG